MFSGVFSFVTEHYAYFGSSAPQAAPLSPFSEFANTQLCYERNYSSNGHETNVLTTTAQGFLVLKLLWCCESFLFAQFSERHYSEPKYELELFLIRIGSPFKLLGVESWPNSELLNTRPGFESHFMSSLFYFTSSSILRKSRMLDDVAIGSKSRFQSNFEEVSSEFFLWRNSVRASNLDRFCFFLILFPPKRSEGDSLFYHQTQFRFPTCSISVPYHWLSCFDEQDILFNYLLWQESEKKVNGKKSFVPCFDRKKSILSKDPLIDLATYSINSTRNEKFRELTRSTFY